MPGPNWFGGRSAPTSISALQRVRINAQLREAEDRLAMKDAEIARLNAQLDEARTFIKGVAEGEDEVRLVVWGKASIDHCCPAAARKFLARTGGRECHEFRVRGGG